MEELRRRCQQKQEYKSRYDLYHKLLTGDLKERATTDRFKQPSANQKETRQAKQEEDGIKSQQRVTKTKMANMRIYYENHSKSSHRINVLYPVRRHYDCKNNKIMRKNKKYKNIFGLLNRISYICSDLAI